MDNPLKTHWSMVKRILIYLSGIPTHSLELSPVNPFQKSPFKPIVIQIRPVILTIGDQH